jgi:hypothetical protein
MSAPNKPPVYISPLYLELIARLMRESGCEYEEVVDFGDWLMQFRDKLRFIAKESGGSLSSSFPSYNAFMKEELHVVSIQMALWNMVRGDPPPP